jgi:hypothetical protein
MKVDIAKIDARKKELGFPVFRNNSKDYNINLTFIRNPDGKVNHFDDIVVIDWYDLTGKRVVHLWEITTDPGLYWLEKPMNINGTAIVIQNNFKTFYVWRDNDKNKKLRYGGPKYNDVTGLNWHHGWNLEKVGKTSAGCQVQSSITEQKKSLEICKNAYDNWGAVSACWLWGAFLD